MKRAHAPGSSRGHLRLKTLKKIAILTLSSYLLLEFKSDVLQSLYVYSPKHNDDPRKKGSSRGHYGLKT